jgi:hypothetical protein
MYVSWNGATEVTQWKFAVADDEEVDGARFFVIGKKDKTGFETVAQFDQGGIFAIAYALDREGNVLGKAAPVKCVDFVDAGKSDHTFEDPGVFRRPPGVGAVTVPVVDDVAAPDVVDGTDRDVSHEGQEADAVSEGGKEWPRPSPSPTAPAKLSDGETEKKHQQEKEQEQKEKEPHPPVEAAAPGKAPPGMDGIDRAVIGSASPRLLTIILFLSVSSAGVLLLMRRLRRRIF